jgi:hypothetical protein
MRRVHLVTQAYGKEEILTEALYAAWSALAWRGDLPLDVHVYTDDAAAFAPLGREVDVRVLSPAEIAAWRGPHDFIHRLKAEMIRDVVRRFPGEKLVYVDADVFFTGPLAPLVERIAPGRAVMHLREYPVATHRSSQMKKFRAHMSPLRFRGKPIDLTRDMWNAGVVGMDPAQFGIVDEWIEFIDAIYPHYKRGLVEQYGIGHLLQREAEVRPTDDVVFHYWFQKDDYVAAIRRELDLLRAEPLEASLGRLRENVLRLPVRKQRSSFWDRVRRVVTGKG